MAEVALPATVPCTAKRFHNGKPCGKCRICQMATLGSDRYDPYRAWQWGATDEKPAGAVVAKQVVTAPTRPTPNGGPGTELKKLFAKGGFNVCAKCNSIAKQMDHEGPGWCRANLDTIANAVEQNAKTQGVKAVDKMKAAASMFFSGEGRLLLDVAKHAVTGHFDEKSQIRVMVEEAIRRAEARDGSQAKDNV